MKTRVRLPFVLLAFTLLLAACGNKAAAPSAAAPVISTSTVTSEGHLVPRDNLYLSFPVAGRVSEILVKKGDKVTHGQTLVRLGDRQQAQAALAAAQLQLVSAQQNLDALNRTAALDRAQAWQAYMHAQEVSSAAQHDWDQLDPTAIQTDIDNAQADAATFKTDLGDAQTDFNKYKDLPADNATRKSYEDKLRTAQANYDDAVRKVEDLTHSRDTVRAALDAALAAEAEATRAYDNVQNGPDADKLALAQAGLDNARAQAAAAQSALDDYDLKAPFDGVVMDTNVSLEQRVGPETWAVVVADTSQWYVDTSDLTEQDVVNVSPGQAVTITADALPGVALNGTVEEIADTPGTQGGDVVYTVHVRLQEADPRLRWGMTLQVTFPGQK